jgi:cytoplasmic iron level regulating protein YaaA (DUF328/UPF0246 family)
MIENKIQEVTIRLCHLQKNNNNKPNSKIEAIPKTPKLKSQTNIQNPSIEKKINELLKSLDWKKLNEKKTPKLLIIGCSNSKTQGGTNELAYNYFNNGSHIDLIENRNTRTSQYEDLLLNFQMYFNLNNRGNADYFDFQYNFPFYKSAIDRYSGGKFYTEEHLQLYRQKKNNSNLHILIISGLYGVIEFRDSIIDYHLEIKKKPFWTLDVNTSIHNAVKKYTKENQIENEMVFYSLSQSGNNSYSKALKPLLNSWNNIWITGEGTANRSVNLQNSANCVLRFLNQLP